MTENPNGNSWQAVDGRPYPADQPPTTDVAPPARYLEQERQLDQSTGSLAPAGQAPSGLDSVRRRTRTWPFVLGAGVVGLLVGVGATVAASGFSDSDQESEFRELTEWTSDDELGSAADPLDIGTEFEITGVDAQDDTSATFVGRIDGMLEVDVEFGAPGERCFVVVGEIERVAGSELFQRGNLDVSVTDRGGVRRGQSFGCVVDDVTAAGYAELFGLSLPVGGRASFYGAFRFLAGETPDEFLVGTFDEPGVVVYDAETVDELPDAVDNRERFDFDTIDVGDRVDYVSSTGGLFEVSVEGVVEVPVFEFSDKTTPCFAVLVSVTPEDLGDRKYGSPRFATTLISDGVGRDSPFGDCDTSELEAAGFVGEFATSAEVGTTVDFYITTDLEPDLIVFDDPVGSQPLAFELDLLDEVP